MKLKLVLVASAIGLAASPALAADAIVNYEPPVVEPVAPVVYDWTGVYVGGSVGYVVEYGTQVTASDFADTWFSKRYIRDADGFTGGAYAGYNWTTGNNVLFGIEGDLDYGDVSGSRNTYMDAASTSVDVGLQGSLRADRKSVV